MSFTSTQPRLDRATYEEARRSWDENGPWASEWREWRRLAAQSGIVFAPDGSYNDRGTDDQPSQRAILYRAIVDTPSLLRDALRQSTGTFHWARVVEHVIRGRQRIAEEIEQDERDIAYDRSRLPSRAEASRVLHRVGMIVDDNDRRLVTAAFTAGRCPTCGQSVPVDPVS